MSVIVNNLTKKYANQLAVDNLSFEAIPGEILGFLGPNGAGKSTTLKAITGYLEPTSGSIKVCGYDVLADPILARAGIGYLPEHNPLYPEMYVHEYLRFMGGLNGLKGLKLRARVSDMVSLCALTAEQNKTIGTLSKGYRQRVGLAQALLHDPPVLVLDEPTSGLDPNQIVEIRKLIKEVSQNKTLIFSSHILSEVQALCDRVLIIHQGKPVLDEKAEGLTNAISGTKTLVVEFSEQLPEAELASIKGVIEVSSTGGSHYKLKVEAGQDIRAEVFRYASEQNKILVELREEEGSLEDIFHQLTK